MSRHLSAVLLLSAALSAFPATANAQKPTEACMCSASFAMVTLALRDAKGAPVQDAIVRVRRVSTKTERVASADIPGHYTIADDMLKDSVRAAGEPFEVTVQWKGRTQRVVVRVGTQEPPADTRATAPVSACRCHVRRIAGPESLTLR
jgi:hypothetical protein